MLRDCHLLIGYVLLVLDLGGAAFLPDYEYDRDAGWLRLHIVPATWSDARVRCLLEGATLASPTTSAIAGAMKTKLVAYKLAERSVFTGVRKYISNPKGDFTTVDDISLQWAEGEPNNLDNSEDCLAMTGAGELADVSCASVHPYFCIKSDAKVSENKCDTTSEGYTWEPRTGSCYKFHRVARTWRRAAMVCTNESATLAVINSDVESQVLKELYVKNPPEVHIGSETNYLVHIGILDWNESGNWLTVFGDTLDEAGFKKWDQNEPNNIDKIEYCGSMARNGLLNDSPCASHTKAFICEMTPKKY